MLLPKPIAKKMITGKNNFFSKYQEIALTFLMALGCLLLFTFFPTDGNPQKITSGIVFLCILPLLFLKFVLKKNFRDFGWQLGNWRAGLVYSLLYLTASLLIFYLFFHYTSFAKNYSLPQAVVHNFWYFIFYELLIAWLFTLLYEIFFRGFLMFSLSPKTGIYAIFYQFFAIFLFFWATGSLNWNNSPFLTAAFFSGLTALKSRSLLYSFADGLFFLVILDALVIKFSY